MHRTKLPLRMWFLAMFLVASGKPCSARWMAMTFKVNYRSALGMLRKIRKAMRHMNGPHPLCHLQKMIVKQLREQSGKINEPAEPEKAEEVQKIKEAENPKSLGEACDSAEIGKSSFLKTRMGRGISDCCTVIEKLSFTNKWDVIGKGHMPDIRVHNLDHFHVVERAVRFMFNKAMAFIRRVYKNIRNENLQSYIDEFYYRWMGRFGQRRFDEMLSVTLQRSFTSTMVYL